MKKENAKAKYILITGGTSGLGLELVKLFLDNGYLVIAMGRQHLSIPEYNDKFKLYQVDFNDLKQVAEITNIICREYNIKFIINNAGILSPPAYTKTINGYEYTFQINFLIHLLINEIILQNIHDNELIKLVSVTSPVYKLADRDIKIETGEHGYIAWKAYSSSKLYQVLMCELLPARHPELNLKCFSFNPGTFSSGIYRMQKEWFRKLYHIASPFMRSPVKVANILMEILIKDNVENGMIYDFRKNISSIQLIDKKEKEDFMKTCYNKIEPYLK